MAFADFLTDEQNSNGSFAVRRSYDSAMPASWSVSAAVRGSASGSDYLRYMSWWSLDVAGTWTSSYPSLSSSDSQALLAGLKGVPPSHKMLCTIAPEPDNSTGPLYGVTNRGISEATIVSRYSSAIIHIYGGYSTNYGNLTALMWSEGTTTTPTVSFLTNTVPDRPDMRYCPYHEIDQGSSTAGDNGGKASITTYTNVMRNARTNIDQANLARNHPIQLVACITGFRFGNSNTTLNMDATHGGIYDAYINPVLQYIDELGIDCYGYNDGFTPDQLKQAHLYYLQKKANFPNLVWSVPEFGWEVGANVTAALYCKDTRDAVPLINLVKADVASWPANERPTNIIWFNNGGQPFDGVDIELSSAQQSAGLGDRSAVEGTPGPYPPYDGLLPKAQAAWKELSLTSQAAGFYQDQPAADFAALQTRIRPIIDAANTYRLSQAGTGVYNDILFGPAFTAYSWQRNDTPSGTDHNAFVDDFYPGNGIWDFLGVDAYSRTNPAPSAATLLGGAYAYAINRGADSNTGVVHDSIPLAISELGFEGITDAAKVTALNDVHTWASTRNIICVCYDNRGNQYGDSYYRDWQLYRPTGTPSGQSLVTLGGF